ncbi:hypothetical protein, partial [Geomicrobium sp. JCM 19039]|uniref:hypothetical protein n=1 Tax=Geomicrobium sp. JCM 19039 TaxID=1460636 RepID=UPI001EE66C97
QDVGANRAEPSSIWLRAPLGRRCRWHLVESALQLEQTEQKKPCATPPAQHPTVQIKKVFRSFHIDHFSSENLDLAVD